MGFDGQVKIYFLNKEKNVIKSDSFTCWKMCPDYLQLKIVPNAEYVQVCFSNDDQSCECIYCIKEEEQEQDDTEQEETEQEETEEEEKEEEDEEIPIKRKRLNST
ncbi:hypothetical protein HaMNV_gp023 [Helicoverpa armigera multiple nucleopolyhedrovirus]|uniref:Orf23 n=1 Tax=Mamestra brassicae nuclear polyhedrosis virus TaxID=78219 RepID=I3XM41_NPVMB|nr:hypothetical protein [Mamestra brassicae multiple nucleopolyhedrovirus]ACH88545.1 hypothetical protein HaMNV_gp023 [Helicoverpa armigera multiple nucleopolyhedrovirus]WRQ96596.1 maco-B 24 [Mamestra configurata nucleopolyhedrovirus B]AFL64874.1 hypothetical protein [Mamestra brassicae multiple nucleopolyhedrovirus]AIL25101.1 Orf23 [Mamestra brassicae multiple nucleopolyhedrovirus]WRQ96757.1 maco-B 24 [Mamestra configurata nucleopolyhedrovirus B]